jgi:murein L,D-transpeptidase YafK
MNRKSVTALLIIIASILVYGFGYFLWSSNIPMYIYSRLLGRKTVEDIVKLYESRVEKDILPIFIAKNINYPPQNLTILAFKEEKLLEIWTISNGKPIFIKKYPFTTTSGKQGPKLNRGDKQIPEGFYKIESLNPNSSFHLSLKINFPNEFDLEKSKIENRMDPGDNIFIHGKDQSIGCIAIGDIAIEELFLLSAKTPRKNLDVILFPYDMRNYDYIYSCNDCPPWTQELYERLKKASNEFIQ